MKNILRTIMMLICLLSIGQQASAAHWSCNIGSFKNDMTLYFSPVVDGNTLSSLEGYEIAAFCGDECRGVASIETVAGKGSYGYLRVRSNKVSGETISFKLYRESDSQEVTTDYTLSFESGIVKGKPSAQETMAFNCLYNLVYKVDGAKYKSARIAYGKTIVAEDNPSKEGHTFSGWSDIPATMPAQDYEINGTFSVNSYVLKYEYTKDGKTEEYSSESVAYGTPLTKKENLLEEGYVFSGWSTVPETMPARDITITASFTKGTYKVLYYVDNELYQTIGASFDEEITPISYPERTGYTFSGWTGFPENKKMPSCDLRIDGTFTVNQHTVTYKVDGVQQGEPVTYNYGAKIIAMLAPEREGHTFSGWTGFPEDMKMPDEDIIITGSFAVNSYTLVYMVDNATYKTFAVPYGTTIDALAEPTKEGYTFSGWEGLPLTMPARKVTVKGSFTINTYKLTYYLNDETYKVYDVTYGDEIDIEAAPGKKGYTFSGWSAVPATMPAKDVDVKGYLTRNVVPGDANDDNVITIADVAAVIAYLNGTTPEKFNEASADADGDGNITPADAKKLSEMIIGK